MRVTSSSERRGRKIKRETGHRSPACKACESAASSSPEATPLASGTSTPKIHSASPPPRADIPRRNAVRVARAPPHRSTEKSQMQWWQSLFGLLPQGGVGRGSPARVLRVRRRLHPCAQTRCVVPSPPVTRGNESRKLTLRAGFQVLRRPRGSPLDPETRSTTTQATTKARARARARGHSRRAWLASPVSLR